MYRLQSLLRSLFGELHCAPLARASSRSTASAAIGPAALAPHIQLDRYEVPFTSPKFTQQSTHIEFYEDPTDSKTMDVVASVELSHPVSKPEFERRLGFRMIVEPVGDFDDATAKPFGFQVTYDDVGGKAFIHSAS